MVWSADVRVPNMRRHIAHIWILLALVSSALAKVTNMKSAYLLHYLLFIHQVHHGLAEHQRATIITPEGTSVTTTIPIYVCPEGKKHIFQDACAQYKVKCSEDSMVAELRRTDDVNAIYLEGLKYFPDPACKPILVEHKAVFKLSLSDFFHCGVTRVLNQATGFKTFYHRIVLEKDNEGKEVIQIKCTQGGNHTLVKRNVLPAGFQEPITLDITKTIVEKAPQPKLGVGVRQAGELVSGELNVNPGTPLQMEIYLDNASAPIYGLLVSYMAVSDTKKQEEPIIINGCSIDPYLFDNFNTIDGDFLTAKFRAFKFPDSTYVQFKGTVNVCLDKCRGVECSNGHIGFGRRRREVSAMPPDPNKVFEVSISSYIKVDYKGDSLLEKVKLDLGSQPVQLLDNNGTLVREVAEEDQQRLKVEGEAIREDLLYTVVQSTNASSGIAVSSTITAALFIVVRLLSSSR